MPALNPIESKIVQTAGDAIFPPAGTAIASFLGFLNIRGKTQHLSYSESDAQSHVFERQIWPLWKANLEMPDFNYISQNYLPRLFQMISTGKYGSGTTWGDSPRGIVNSVDQANRNQTGIDERVGYALYFHFIYILMNEDVSRVQETVVTIWAAQMYHMFFDRPSLANISEAAKNAPPIGSPPLTAGMKSDGLVFAGLAGLGAFLLSKPK